MHRTHSLRSSCWRKAAVLFRRVVMTLKPSADLSIAIALHAVVARNVDSDAENVTAAEFKRWCSTSGSDPVQKPPPLDRTPDRLPTNAVNIGYVNILLFSTSPVHTPKDTV